jgi:Zn-dependent protease with chaperone function
VCYIQQSITNAGRAHHLVSDALEKEDLHEWGKRMKSRGWNAHGCSLLLLVVLTVLFLLSPILAHASVAMVVTSRDGQRSAFTFSDFDDKRLIFELRLGKADRELDLRGVSFLQFSPYDSAAVAPVTDTLDVFTMADGKIARGIFHRMDDEKVYVLLEEGHREGTIQLSSLRQIAFSPTILDVDRREFGKGFNLFGDDIEVQIASFYGQEVETNIPVLQDSLVEGYVSALGHRIAASSKRPGLPYEFKVLNSGQVNAFTVGGGKIYVYRGLLEQMGSESELAGVIAHEIGHNVGKHTVRQLSKTLLMQGIVTATGELVKTRDKDLGQALEKVGGVVTYFTTLKYSRDDEREADFLAVYNLYAQGIDPRGMVSALETLKRNEPREPSKFEVFFATHPSLNERVDNTSSEMRKLSAEHCLKDSPAFKRMEDHLSTLPRPIARQVLLADTLHVAANVRLGWSCYIDISKLKNCVLKAKFWAHGGSGNDIRVLILDEMNYQNFWNGHPALPAYDSGVLTTGEASVPIAVTGTYYLVLDNTFSLFTKKAVVLNLWTEYTE